MNSSLRPSRGQFLLVDVFKAIAAQVIVFHHMSIYGPISRQALSSSNLVQWLSDYGRFAVQVFLVLGGYLAMMTLPSALEKSSLIKALINRYLRLVPTFVVVIILTTLAAFFARQYLADEFVGSPETLVQVISHIFLLQGILSIESISAGAWYIAIDWQLYALLAILISLVGRTYRLVLILVALMLGGFFYFSKNERFDVWMIYFIGSYGLGVIAYLISDHHDLVLAKFTKFVGYFLGIFLLIAILFGAGAKAVVALMVFVTLLLSNLNQFNMKFNHSSKLIEFIKWFSHRSYCLFLIHYPFILLFNALYEKFNLSGYGLSVLMMWMIWGVSLIASNYLYQWVEKPCRKWQIH